MHDTIPHPAPRLDDVQIEAARRALAELPEADENEQPYFWVGRLRVHLETLTTAWPSGVPGGLDDGQREVLGKALADALESRGMRGGGRHGRPGGWSRRRLLAILITVILLVMIAGLAASLAPLKHQPAGIRRAG